MSAPGTIEIWGTMRRWGSYADFEIVIDHCRSYHLNEVISMLEEDEEFFSADVFITPPDQGEVTDEDSAPEDDGGKMDNLSGGQLRSMAEAVLHVSNDTQRVGGEESEEADAVIEDRFARHLI